MIEKTLNLAKKEKLHKYDEIKFRAGQLASRKNEYKESIIFLESIEDEKISNKMKIDKYALLGKDYDKTQKYRKAFFFCVFWSISFLFFNLKKVPKTNIHVNENK